VYVVSSDLVATTTICPDLSCFEISPDQDMSTSMRYSRPGAKMARSCGEFTLGSVFGPWEAAC